MKKIIFGLVLYTSSFGVNAADCGGMLVSLDEFRYMDVEELQRLNCSVPKFAEIYSQMMNVDELGACAKVISLTTKVLEREHDSAPLSKEECAEKYPTLVD